MQSDDEINLEQMEREIERLHNAKLRAIMRQEFMQAAELLEQETELRERFRELRKGSNYQSAEQHSGLIDILLQRIEILENRVTALEQRQAS